MDQPGVAKTLQLGDLNTSDVLVRLRNCVGRPENFYSHSSVLVERSKFFAERLSHQDSSSCVEINCSEINYDHHVKLLRLLYVHPDLLLDSLDSVKSAVGILEVSGAFRCEEITKSCIQYLEAVPWDDNEEEEILKVVPRVGPMAMPIIARVQPVDFSGVKTVFISALRFAMSNGVPCPPFGDELKTSAQEQVDYMLGEDDDLSMVASDEDVKSAARSGLLTTFSSLEDRFSSLLLESNLAMDDAEATLLHCVSDIEWMCNLLPRLDLMKDLVLKWEEVSGKLLQTIEDSKLDSVMWGLKLKLIVVTGKVFDVVGYGNVILPAPCRVQLLKTWLPYIRKLKPLLDAKGAEDLSFPHKMDEDLCQSIEGAIVSLVLTSPSNDQADILADWMNCNQLQRYPDLSEAFEVWCYRTKSAKRRLLEGGLDGAGNAPVSL